MVYELTIREEVLKLSNVVFVRNFKFPRNCSSEGRVFYKDTVYEAHYVEVDTRFPHGWVEVRFYAENGYFNFTEELFDRVIDVWELIEVGEHELVMNNLLEMVDEESFKNFISNLKEDGHSDEYIESFVTQYKEFMSGLGGAD